MVYQCCICHTQPPPSVVLFPFPSSYNEREKWARFANINVNKITLNHRICSRHFMVSDFVHFSETGSKLLLKKDAVPSELCDIINSKCASKSNRPKGFSCTICGVISQELSFHRFPAEKSIRSQWAAFCGINEEELKDWQGLCDKHFVEDDFIDNTSYTTSRKLLKKSRIPSQHRPSTSDTKETSLSNNVDLMVGCSPEDFLIVDEDSDDNDGVEFSKIDSSNISSCNSQTVFLYSTSNQRTNAITLTSKRRFPRYFMDIKSQDVNSPKFAKLCLEMGRETVLKYRKKIETLQRENKKLQKKLLSSEEVFLQLKNHTISMDEAVRTIERRNIFKFANKSCIL